jgi:flavin-dependent thymidylate synthase
VVSIVGKSIFFEEDNMINDYCGNNKVELIGVYGGDESHALSAWTSTSRDLTDEKRNRMGKLLRDLAQNGHETPFEKSSLHFLVTSDIGSHIHLIKHRIGVSVNAESARYKELKDDKYYVPVDWDDEERERYVLFVESALQQYHQTLERLVSKGVPRKRAKESARFYLPYGNQITADVMFNFRSFVHFQRLRNSVHAQVEIRNIAEKMLQLVRDTRNFDMSISAFDL